MSESAFINIALLQTPKSISDATISVLRVILYEKEIHRLSQAGQVQVLSGTAWATVAGEDIILPQGKKMSISSGKDVVVVSPLGDLPLVLEIKER